VELSRERQIRTSQEDTISTQSTRRGSRLPDFDLADPEVAVPRTTSENVLRFTAAALRLSLGWVFL
jgi:hypothetical protein